MWVDIWVKKKKQILKTQECNNQSTITSNSTRTEVTTDMMALTTQWNVSLSLSGAYIACLSLYRQKNSTLKKH